MVSLSQSSDSDSQFLSLDSDLLSQDSLLSQGSQEDSTDTALLEVAKLWSLAEVEQKSSDLLQAAKSVLQDPGSGHELKLEAVGWLVERLLQLVPVFEVEDAILAPVLEVVREFLEEVEQLVGRAEAGAREQLVSLTISLLGYSHSLVKHVKEQEGCGLGEVPSLPRLLPPILDSSLRCVRKMSP